MGLCKEGYFNSGVPFLNLAMLHCTIPSKKHLETTRDAENTGNFLYPD